MKLSHSHGHVLGGSFLIAGTTVGVGMLALPVATGPAGFLPSLLIYVACWAFMFCTGLLVLEVCTWMPEDTHLLTMSERLFGKTGKIISWLLYLFLFETIMIAHVSGGGGIVKEILLGNLGLIPSMIVYVILFAPIIYLGTRIVDRINLFMFSGVLITYFLFIFVSAAHIDSVNLKAIHWGKIWFAIPVLFTAFSYQVIIPTLVTYMKRDFKKIRKAIFIGTAIPLIVYVIWQVLILGIIPVDGPNGLIEAQAKEETAVIPLKFFIGSTAVIGIGRAFAFFTMTASYIALALAFFDFLADGLHMKKVGWRKLVLCIAVFVPPLFISFINPQVFITALEYAGGISCAILFGLYPPLMVWIGRYNKGYRTGKQMPGGKTLLAFLMLLMVLELGLEVTSKFVKF